MEETVVDSPASNSGLSQVDNRRGDFSGPRVLRRLGVGCVIAAILLLTTRIGAAQIITTSAGNGTAAFLGDGGLATNAALNRPRGVAFDASGNMYIADYSNHRIRRVTPSGIISTYAGNGTPGFSGDGGLAVTAQVNLPEDVIVDASGNVYIADSSNHRVRKVSPAGIISTIAGVGSFGYSGDNIAAVSAQLNRPTSLAMDAAGNLYVADSSNHRVRRIALNGIITTYAGNGIEGYAGNGGQAASASLRFPVGIALDGVGNLYIADAGNHVVREVTPSGIIFNAAGNGTGAGTDTGSFSGDGSTAAFAGLNTPEDVVVDSAGNLFIADTANNRIRKVVPVGIITTVVGIGLDGFSGDFGPATSARLNLPWAVAINAAGNLSIGDLANHRVRMVNVVASPALPLPGPPPGSETTAPVVLAGGVVNGASFRRASDPGGAVAAGAIVSIFGQNLATTTADATSTPLPTNLAGTSVTFGGVPAPLFFVSPTQINVQVPFGMAGGATAVQVTRSGLSSAVQIATLAAFSPGIFTSPPGGTGAGAILHATSFLPVSVFAPARAGGSLAIYSTGMGAVFPSTPSGFLAPSSPPLSQTLTTPLVTIGGIPAQIQYSGLAPGFVGLYQINVAVPAGTPAGSSIPLVISMGGVVSNTVTIFVQ